jgi:hypothetical protein
MMNKKMLSLLAMVVGIGAVVLTMKGSVRVKPAPDSFTFERNVQGDEGAALVPTDIVSNNNNVRLSEVFNSERIANYGGFTHSGKPSGGELKVTFVWKDGNKVTRTETFVVEEDKTEANNSIRNKYVAGKREEFAKIVGGFTAPIGIKRAFGVALDTTEGVTPELADRVRQVIAETRVQFIGANPKNMVTLNLYNITENPYQGGRQRPALTVDGELEKAAQWLLAERPGRNNSSVLGGLKAVVEEMAEFGDANPTLHIFTDGLENTDTLSVYKKPELFEDANVAALDAVFDLTGVKLAGLKVHLHPLPAKSARQATMMQKGLKYIAGRLAKAGAAVKIEPL